MGHKHTKRVSSPNFDISSNSNDSDHLDDSSDSGTDFALGDNTSKEKRPMTRSSKKTFSAL